MTKATVEVQETRTVKESVTVCDDCQREVDENGMEFTNTNGSGGTATAEQDVRLHYCSECLREMTDGEVEPAYIERAREWYDTEWETVNGNYRMEDRVRSAANVSHWSAVAGGVLAVVFIFLPAIGVTLPFENALILLYSFTVTMILTFTAVWMSSAVNALDKANENLK